MGVREGARGEGEGERGRSEGRNCSHSRYHCSQKRKKMKKKRIEESPLCVPGEEIQYVESQRESKNGATERERERGVKEGLSLMSTSGKRYMYIHVHWISQLQERYMYKCTCTQVSL